MSSRGRKACCAVSCLFLIIVIVVIVALALTVFKIKDPIISVHPLGLDHLQFTVDPNSKISVAMLITMVNRNFGSFRYIDSTGYVNYRGTIVAEIPILSHYVPARSTINVTTNAEFMVGKMIENPMFIPDFVTRKVINMTSRAELPGKVIVLKFIKIKAMAYSTCNISLNLYNKTADTNCISKIKL
ncbi:hypothetical protein TanjilG_01353 [Lupinus angustifolius]|uniref:Late embryogenesis abundant protein LEA-2 subgroup domain-containing protein n=1 Tax=Lupinus angustifolius TaxID=3871 RepID=A0A1J7H8R5_LUPAN|nr:PREDICTED: uncharacterized protein LOC109350603 [Lupinus angustifolius]XP_019448113.1 PREDICTED: uncharacterized protein LOC109351193 [Lupinus angustifolius]OIW09232.1 hypothetical protein TanjilG_26445 [Lupinus angustifolius]OIW09382.1 hypothetical protein TanjilG_01353 [Lupinus angustifolius]